MTPEYLEAMIRVSLDRNRIIIDGSENPAIFEWEHRSFFILAMGFELNSRLNQYVFSVQSELHKTLLETINYLKEEELRFEFDQNVANLLGQIEAEQSEYEQALILGKKLKAKKKSLTHPVGFIRQLEGYQLKGFEHILTVKNGANFSVPGSGKTSVIYAAFEKLRQENLVDKLLVIGPRSCFQPWEDEAKACIKRNIISVRLGGSKRDRTSIYLQSGEFELFLCTYQTATNDKDELISLCKQHKVYVVIDESHNIKSFGGGVWAEAMLEIAPYATRRAILSGTPIPNKLTDLWSQMTFLWPGEQVLGDRNSYRYRCEDEKEIKSIREAVKPFIFRTTKVELGLPAPKFIYHYCDLSPYQQSIYNALSTKLLQDLALEPLERIALREWRKSKIVRLIQAATNPTLLAKYSDEFDVPPISGEGVSLVQLIEKYPQFEMPSKFQLALKVVRELIGRREKVILWTTFVFNIQMLQQALIDIEPLIVYGAVPKDADDDTEFNREQQIRKFKESSYPLVLIANPAACAESISLHKVCHHAVYLDRTFNCGQYLQSLDRIHRIGLAPDEIVTYHLILANQTIDETIDKRLIEKEKNMLKILEDELPLGSFDADDRQLGQSDDEEKIDFDQTVTDIQKHLGQELTSQ